MDRAPTGDALVLDTSDSGERTPLFLEQAIRAGKWVFCKTSGPLERAYLARLARELGSGVYYLHGADSPLGGDDTPPARGAGTRAGHTTP